MRVLITESKSFSERAVARLREAGHEVELGEHTYDSLREEISNFDGLIVRLGIHVDEELLAGGKRLKFVATLTTGVDHIAVAEAERLGVSVISLRGEREFLDKITPTAELAWGLILSLARNLVPAVISVKQGEWERDRFVGHTLGGRSLGVVGLGRLGSQVANIGEGFGMTVRYFDPMVISQEYERVGNLLDLARRTDVVSVHVPLEESTERMFDGKFFATCRPRAIFVNTSRGGLVDERALLAALEGGQLAGAALDVMAGEVGQRRVEGRLIDYARDNDNLIITPHIGGATVEAMRSVEDFVVSKVLERLHVAAVA